MEKAIDSNVAFGVVLTQKQERREIVRSFVLFLFVSAWSSFLCLHLPILRYQRIQLLALQQKTNVLEIRQCFLARAISKAFAVTDAQKESLKTVPLDWI